MCALDGCRDLDMATEIVNCMKLTHCKSNRGGTVEVLFLEDRMRRSGVFPRLAIRAGLTSYMEEPLCMALSVGWVSVNHKGWDSPGSSTFTKTLFVRDVAKLGTCILEFCREVKSLPLSMAKYF